jgi:small-conductance mechanosensitive channel
VLWKIINFFFIPIEIKAVHYELRILFHQFFPHCPHLLVDKTLKACQVDRDEIVQGIRKEKRLAHEIAVTIVNNISANMLATITKYIVWFFAFIIALGQLGVAPYFMSVLFTEIVGMLAVAGALAFGLGGKDAAARLISKLGDDMSHR